MKHSTLSIFARSGHKRISSYLEQKLGIYSLNNLSTIVCVVITGEVCLLMRLFMLKTTFGDLVVMRGDRRSTTVTESEVREVALRYIVEQRLDSCDIVSIERFCRNRISQPKTIGDEWVVQLQFDNGEDVSTHFAMIIIDDATGIAQVSNSL